MCLDGTQYAFYVDSVAPNSTHGTKWVLFFEGGGWCYSPVDCLKRSKSRLGSAKGLAPTLNPAENPLQWFEAEGPLSADPLLNPLFSQYNRAFLRYCDGNSFTGKREQPLLVGAEKVYMRGRFPGGLIS